MTVKPHTVCARTNLRHPLAHMNKSRRRLVLHVVALLDDTSTDRMPSARTTVSKPTGAVSTIQNGFRQRVGAFWACVRRAQLPPFQQGDSHRA